MKTILWMTLFISAGMVFADASIKSLTSLSINAAIDHATDLENAEKTSRSEHNYYSGFSRLSSVSSAD
ncbi:MAG: hypothetical protein AAF542_20120 [Pseudomonadota bacterium]